LAYDQFAEQLVNFPVPKGLPEEFLVELKPQFDQQAEPVKAKAAEAFASAVQKSQELDVFNPCTTGALEMLRTKYKPEAFPKMKEDVLELTLPAEKQTAIGADVLTTIQAVPIISPEKAAETKAAPTETTAKAKAEPTNEMDLTAGEKPEQPEKNGKTGNPKTKSSGDAKRGAQTEPEDLP
jgi:hypothetical protein